MCSLEYVHEDGGHADEGNHDDGTARVQQLHAAKLQNIRNDVLFSNTTVGAMDMQRAFNATPPPGMAGMPLHNGNRAQYM